MFEVKLREDYEDCFHEIRALDRQLAYDVSPTKPQNKSRNLYTPSKITNKST